MAAFAPHGATMAVFLSAARPDELAAELLTPGSGYGPDTPAAIVVRASWPDEQVVRTTVGRLADDLRATGATMTALVLVGEALADRPVPQRSHLYEPGYTTAYRLRSPAGSTRAARPPAARRPGRDRERRGGAAPSPSSGSSGPSASGRTAEAALRAADVVLGTGRLLDALPADVGGKRIELAGSLAETLDLAAERRALGERVCLLASGDPGFFGIVRVASARFGPEALEIHPAPSSVAVAFARAGIHWDDAVVVSAHGRPLAAAVEVARRQPKVAVLTAPTSRPRRSAGRSSTPAADPGGSPCAPASATTTRRSPAPTSTGWPPVRSRRCPSSSSRRPGPSTRWRAAVPADPGLGPAPMTSTTIGPG